MRHLYINFILVVVSYSLALNPPVLAKQVSSADSYADVQAYVNGSGKRTFRGLVQKMEKDLPTNLYDEAIQKTKGVNGKSWFSAAKMASNYVYLRFIDSKVFVRLAIEKGDNVFYANGIKITESDFRDIKKVQNKLFIAYVKGLPASKKTSFLNLFELNKAEANTKFEEAETAVGAPLDATKPAVSTECDLIHKTYINACQQKDWATADDVLKNNSDKCGFSKDMIGKAQTASTSKNDKMGLWIFLGAALLMFLLARKKKKKKAAEVPEDTNGVGRGGNGNGHVNCGGAGAQCGDDTSTVTNPGEPVAPPSSDDPNYYDDSSDSSSTDTSGRTDTSNSVFKTKK